VICRRSTHCVRSLVGARLPLASFGHPALTACWVDSVKQIERMTLTSKRDRNLNSFQIANSAPRLIVTASAIAPSATIRANFVREAQLLCCRKANGEHMAHVRQHWDFNFCMWGTLGWAAFLRWRSSTIWSTMAETLCGTLLEFHDPGI
jgi:hypothetical protein